MAPTNSKIHFLDGAAGAGAEAAETTNKASAQKALQSGSSGGQLFDFSGNFPLDPMAARPLADGGLGKNKLVEDDTISEEERATYIVPNNEWIFVPQQASAIDGSKYKFQANSLTVMNLTANLVASNNSRMTTRELELEAAKGREGATTKVAEEATTTDRDQFYKCLAINALGQTTSTSSFRLSHNCK